MLIAIVIPPLHFAHRQAKQTQCSANLKSLGTGCGAMHAQIDTEFYPLWDDSRRAGTYADWRICYTWIDVLLQMNMINGPQGGYCPEDQRPDLFNRARGEQERVLYPGKELVPGIDYSYGIGVPLSAGGWAWNPDYADPDDPGPRYFADHDQNTAGRVLAGDASWSCIYNLNGAGLLTGAWNDPTQFDNTVAWQRHPGFGANLLMQDGHVATVRYRLGTERPVETQKNFVWYPNEPIDVNHNSGLEGNYYPDHPPVNFDHPSFDDPFATELIPEFYTVNRLWKYQKHQ
jgi:prepilin-type processing-associated H-X9-DG protein